MLPTVLGTTSVPCAADSICGCQQDMPSPDGITLGLSPRVVALAQHPGCFLEERGLFSSQLWSLGAQGWVTLSGWATSGGLQAAAHHGGIPQWQERKRSHGMRGRKRTWRASLPFTAACVGKARLTKPQFKQIGVMGGCELPKPERYAGY